jgi:MinD superfamily P-loop ATPase
MKLARRLPGDVKVTNMISSGYSVAIDTGACVSCGACVDVCAFMACRQVDGGIPVYDWEACFGCGVCTTKCPSGARKLVLDADKGVPLDVGPMSVETGT